MEFDERDKESVYLRLFPFSLLGKVEEWLKSYPNQSLTPCSDVEEFCKGFSLHLVSSKLSQKFQISFKDQTKHSMQHGRDLKLC